MPKFTSMDQEEFNLITTPGGTQEKPEFASLDNVELALERGIVSYSELETMAKKIEAPKHSPEELAWRNDHPFLAQKADRVNNVLDFIPYARFRHEEERERFMDLDKQHQVRSLLMDALGVAALVPGALPGVAAIAAKPLSPVLRSLGKGYRVLRRKPTIKPVEEVPLAGARMFSRDLAVAKKLKQMGFSPNEIPYLIDQDLPSFMVSQAGRRGQFSAGFKKEITWDVVEGRFGPVPRFSQKLLDATDDGILRAKHYRKEWRRVMAQTVGKEYTSKYPERIFNGQVERFMGKNAVGTYKLSEATPELMVNFLGDALRHPKVLAGLTKQKWYSKIMPDTLSPSRVALGTMDKPYGTYKNVYRRVTNGLTNANKYSYQQLHQFYHLLEKRGLGTLNMAKLKKTGKLDFQPAFGADESANVFGVMKKVDGLTQAAMKNPIIAERLHTQIAALTKTLSPSEHRLLRATHDFFDSLYADYVTQKIPQVFHNAGMTAAGARALDVMMGRMVPKLATTMSRGSGASYHSKMVVVDEFLAKARGFLKHPMVEQGRHPWFVAKTPKELMEKLASLTDELTMTGGKKGGKFPGYLDNYVPRIRQNTNRMQSKWRRSLIGERAGFFRKERKAVLPSEQLDDFGATVGIRISSQASDLFLYPQMAKAAQAVKTAPGYVKLYVDDYLSKVVSRGSIVDEKLANILNRLPDIRGLGWDEGRVRQLGISLNNWAFVGGLGFKPVSIIRNLFQPLITVPADLGGARALPDLLAGYWRTANPVTGAATRRYIRKIGAIQEFLPELASKTTVFPFQKGMFGQKVRDVALYGFKKSDEFNRYISGGAALNRWDNALGRVGEKVLGIEKRLFKLDERSIRAGEEALRRGENIAHFSRKVGLDRRYPWVREEIEEALRLGRFDDAKAIWTKDVIADTQWLYGVAETPTVSGRAGIVGKTGAIFQTWWMSYGASLEKWIRTGSGLKPGDGRMFNWMISGAIAGTLMEPMFGERYTAKTIFTGPFPTTINRYMLPPAWTPIWETGTMMLSTIPTAAWQAVIHGDPKAGKAVVDQAKAIARSTVIFAPGGLQAEKMIKGTVGEGMPGLAKAIIGYHRTKEYKQPWFIPR